MDRKIRWYDYITINIFYLGLTTLTTTNALIFPLLVQQFVGESSQGTYFGILRLWTLMAALLAQSAMGIISDQSVSRWGRRRPFIFIGSLINVFLILSIGLSTGMQGYTGYWILLSLAILLFISTNTAQAAQQGLIPDIVPKKLHGRFSGVKALFELPLPLLLVSFTVASLIGEGNFWGGLFIAMIVLLVTMAITMFVPEKPGGDTPSHFDWSPLVRLFWMTAFFTTIILVIGRFVNIFGSLFTGIESVITLSFLMGAIGLLAMIAAVALGVWFSVRISLGIKAQQNPSFSWWVINRLAYLVGVTNLSTFALFYLQARLGMEGEKAAQPASLLIALVGFFVLLTALPAGWLADRFGPKRLVGFSGGLAAMGTLLAILFPNLILIFIGGCIIGAATGMFYTANWALGTSIVPGLESGRYLGISNLAGAGAGAVGAFIGGPIADYFTFNIQAIPGLGYMILFCIYGSLFLFSVFALRWVKTDHITHSFSH